MIGLESTMFHDHRTNDIQWEYGDNETIEDLRTSGAISGRILNHCG
jgi:hypothetical protein